MAKSLSSSNGSAGHYALRSLASAMAYADNTWGEADLWPVVKHLGLDMEGKWRWPIPDRAQSRTDARRLLDTITDPAMREHADGVRSYLR